jgi:uncharacterized protein (TIGR02145 family)
MEQKPKKRRQHMRNTISKLALTASLVLAMAFTFSCSGDDGGGEEKFSYCIKDGFCHEGSYTLEGCSSLGGMPSNNCPNGGGDGSSSSRGGSPSSSSVGGQGGGSSSSGGGDNGNSITYGNDTYPIVAIGTQTWLAKNLNYAVEGSKCYDNDPANCVKYGRLYDWATAMGLPSSCNENSCSSQIQTKHKGICPSGWHIPSNEEWDKLIEAVGGRNTAGTKLKAASGWNWNDHEDKSGNGTDDYGFSALPGGAGRSVSSFALIDNRGFWWSASEYEDDSEIAYTQNVSSYYDDVADESYDPKFALFSVRCVKDN